MELLLALIVIGCLTISNCIAYFLLFLSSRPDQETKLFNKRKTMIAPFVTPMKDADQVDISEIDEDILRQSVRKTLDEGPDITPVDDEEKEHSVYDGIM